MICRDKQIRIIKKKNIVVPILQRKVSETGEGGFIYKLKKLNINGLNYTG